MKVLLLAPLPPPRGGIASWTLRMLDARLKHNWTVDVVDEKVIGNREIFNDKAGVHFLTEVKRTWLIWRNLAKKLKDREFAVVHSNIPAGVKSMLRELGCLIITKFHGRKFIIHFRCTVPNQVKGTFSDFIFRLLTNGSDGIIVLNTPSEVFTRARTRTPVDQIPNFIKSEAIADAAEVKINESVQTALYVGGVVAEKGCLTILEASRAFPAMQFRLVGKSSDLIRKAVTTRNVVLTGEQPGEVVRREMRNADLFLFPSFFPGEGFSNSLLEAMACGLPCIVSDWAANADMIEEKGGIVIPVGDADALVRAIRKLENRELRRSISQWNIEKVRNYYCDQRVTDRYVDVYERVLDQVPEE